MGLASNEGLGRIKDAIGNAGEQVALFWQGACRFVLIVLRFAGAPHASVLIFRLFVPLAKYGSPR